ncbi:hypothetical protein BH18THE2_BH18THE2_29190 [soil metagenome]
MTESHTENNNKVPEIDHIDTTQISPIKRHTNGMGSMRCTTLVYVVHFYGQNQQRPYSPC